MMKINPELLQQASITIGEFAYMLSLYFDCKVTKESLSSLKDRGLLLFAAEMNEEKHYVLSNEGKNFIEDVLTKSETKTDISKTDRFDLLADKLRELFPQGRKEGTNYMWRDSTAIIAKKLRVWHKKYKANYTDEEIIEATRQYVTSFNGNYQYMQLLKYFISKQTVVDGAVEENSQLLSYLQNDNTVNNNDWQTEIR